ncbi:MMPL family transporter [Phytomonospora endophytica]|uniref:RND superfamily putative drug exporter n=1 Tax=Phytomonospora endophytica TaxID=714109 RepID=A0A841FFB1_9ACTN|nr:MMPL family transporter [Phytomonospora endophytica]MBB6034524.1 RND superfamily putative drug exporter [Phytomonospora endophytica]GIG70432.1 exporter [Phytomonospora endophytica]
MLPESKSGAVLAPPRPPAKEAFVDRIAGWSVRHRVVAVTGWFALVVVALLAGALVPGENARATDPGESGVAQDVLRDENVDDPPLESVLVQPLNGSQPDLAAVTELADTLRARPDLAADVRAPLEGAHPDLLTGASALVTFRVAGAPEAVRDNFEAATALVGDVAARHPGTRLAQAGDMSLSTIVDEKLKEDMRSSQHFSLPLTLVILFLVFGALVAAAIPLLLAASVVATGFGLLAVLDNWIPVNSASSVMIMLIGMAVGVDYALFYLRRVREERAAGHGLDAALKTATRTSGRVIVVSGLTVMLCLAGLLFTGLDNFRGLTLGTVLVVGLALLGSVTVLPATLSLLGDRVNLGRLPWIGRLRTGAGESRAWAAIARTVVRRPLWWGTAAALVLIVMALPALSMRLQSPAPTESLPSSVPTIDAAERMREAFPGAPTPARIVVWGPRAQSALTIEAVEDLRERLGVPVTTASVGDVLIVRVPLPGSGSDEASNTALDRLRAEDLPATLGRVDGVEFAVAGRTALARDFAERVGERIWLVFGFVLVLAFVLLLIAFRSVAVSVVSIVLNLLSIGAAYGMLTWVFQDGNLAAPLGFEPYGGILDWLPLLLFVLLFGLSMDYHIFILSRIRERLTAGTPVRDAVVGGVASSAGVVSSAAAIMVAVFTVFVALSAIEYKMLGVGMAVAILIDATLVRGVLLPAAMALVGKPAARPS